MPHNNTLDSPRAPGMNFRRCVARSSELARQSPDERRRDNTTMKLPLFIVITLLIIQTSQCEDDDWLPKLPSILNVVKNNIRTLGKNIRSKIMEYFSDSEPTTSAIPTTHAPTATVEKVIQQSIDNNQIAKSRKERKIRRIILGPPTSQITFVEETPYIQKIIYLLDENPSLKEDKHLFTSRKIPSVLEEATITTSPATPAASPVHCPNEDPSIYFSTPQLIVSHGYSAETHTILTDDGYFLTVHRIPFPKGKRNKVPEKTVLLHHGLLGSSADWVITGPGKALAYILSDAGYDVWLANARGNTYSRFHVSLPTNSFAFWNFTFHDIGVHDLPAVIDYIMDMKGWAAKINYIGHSMGTTVLFTLLSTKTQYNKILRAGFALAPVAYMSEIKSPIKLLAQYSHQIETMMKLLGQNEFLPQSKLLKIISKIFCEINSYEQAICENSMFILCGFDEKQFNRSLIPIILAHTPAGASTRTFIHYAQEIYNEGRFQQFDYGTEGNMKQYGTPKPPEYIMAKVTLPIALLSAENDWLSSDTDVTRLFVQLAKPIDHYIVPLKDFNHIDFLWAIDAPTLVYNKLLNLMEEGVSHYDANEILLADN